jgi:hypothetical protein
MDGTTGAGRLARLRLRYGWGYETSDFRYYGADSGEPDYLGYGWYRYKMRDVVNSKWARSITEDKWIFSRLADSFGLPAPRTFGLYDRTYGASWDLARPLRTVDDLLAELHRLRPDGVVLKPNGGMQGYQLLVLDTVDWDSGRVTTRAGDATTLEEALAGVDVTTALGGYPGYLVQECLRNHPDLQELAPYATNTLRVQTLLGADGEVLVLGAVLRLSRRGRMVDNFSQGGVAVHVDTRTGMTGPGLLKDDPTPVTRHPDSGVEFSGRPVPCWDDVVALVHRGARCLTGLHAIGWDIAVTPAGAVVVEANNNWDLQIVQAHSDGYLVDPEFRQVMAGLGAPLPTGNVVQGMVGRWVWPVLGRLRR